ncbi:hypothetical protein ABZ863_30750 [Saccharomonospora sp. NPDC046836]|uniref:hypothetical protein n=1 Tax=Saccharomonospora sp. NPDC046836 TaxID=3156921 RepID=UPI0034082263
MDDSPTRLTRGLGQVTGFGAVPDELRETAGRIGEAVGGVASMVWRGPSGDYGHPGVQTGWEQFVEQLKAQVEALRDQAEEFGSNLGVAAGRYQETEAGTGATLAGFGDMIADYGGPAVGGAIGGAAGAATSGAIGSVLGGNADGDANSGNEGTV